MKLFNKPISMKKMTRIILSATVLICLLSIAPKAKADSYVYDFWKNIIPSSEGITYKETYYNKDIKNIENVDESLAKFDTLVDMEVYEQKIYLLDQNKTGQTEVPLATSKINDKTGTYPTYAGVSYIVVIDQNFRYEKIVSEFVLTDKAKAKLDEYYHFSTNLLDITQTQYTSSEFVDVLDVETLTSTVSGKEIKFDVTESLTSYHGGKVYLDGVEVSTNDYSVLYQTNTATITFNTTKTGTVEFEHSFVKTPGRAPYLPLSTDFTKAAVRLNNAQGITVTKGGIYIADTENSRILKLNFDFEVEDVYLSPADPSFYQMYQDSYQTKYGVAYKTIKTTTPYYTEATNDKVFKPTKVAVNQSGTVYCIAQDIYEGLVEYNSEGVFNRFLGKNEVTADPLKQMWSSFLSETQLGNMALSLPPMFSNITVSPSNFLYATSMPDSEATTVTKLVKVVNTKGNDIMKRTGYVTPDGDVVYLKSSTDNNAVIGPSVITAIAISETGNYTIVDQTRGRLFTYDAEGNLLYITGEQPGGTTTQGSGNGLSNSIVKPVAVDYLYRTNETGKREEIVIVLDQFSSSIILYETTEFGEAVNEATRLYQNGIISDTYKVNEKGEYVLDEEGNKIVESAGAETYWRKVIKMNTNYELAYLGIGKALNLRGEYKEAMKYFKLAHNATYYSKAFSSYRDAVLNENFNLLMGVVIAFVAAIVILKITSQVNEKNKKITMKGDK